MAITTGEGQTMERAQQVEQPADLRRPPPAVDPARERFLSFAGVSDDREHVLLVDESGTPFRLPVTAGLRAALRPDGTAAPRPGRLETTMDSVLRPRDIQTRIRAGETPEAVAEAAQTTVDKIMPFVAPVLAEREHVAERAQRANVRRPAGESASASRALGDAVEAHLRSLNVDPEGVAWDAWRREDGRWTLVGDYALPTRIGTAHLTYDVRGSYVVLDDEDARWLVGDPVATPPALRDDLQSVRERRLSPVVDPADELPLGDDAIELVADPEPDTRADDEPASQAAVPVDEPLEAFLDESPASDDVEARDDAADAAAAEPDPEPEPPARRPVQKKKGRASVPSWDEIMFGGPSD